MKLTSRTRTLLLVALILVVVIGFAYIVVPANEVATQVAADVQKERALFTPTQSVDIAMAMKLVTHDPPKTLAIPTVMPPMLLYPPTEEELARMSGPV